jgi:excisionase family DNA binding protein
MLTAATEQLLLSINESCYALGFGRTKLYEYIGLGLIETVSIGRRTMIPRASLDEFVARLRQAA